MKLSKVLSVGFITFALGAVPAAHANLIEVSAPNGHGENPLGVELNDSTTYGQVFTVPDGSNTQLDSFSFFVKRTLAYAYAGVASWTGTGAGPALFASAPFPASYGSFQEIVINTGGLDLTVGQQYVAYFSVDGIAGNSGYDAMELGNGATNSVGFVYDNTVGGDPNHNWNGCVAGCSGGNLAYTMAFSQPHSVPEPTSLALIGLGLAGLGFSRRNKA